MHVCIKELNVDGIWIDMNEPAVFGTNEPYPWYWGDPTRPKIKPLFCPVRDNKWDAPPYETWATYYFSVS